MEDAPFFAAEIGLMLYLQKILREPLFIFI